jgi:hypothetical protein
MLAHRIVSKPTRIGNWMIRGSVYKNETICIVAFNEVTKDCQVRFFDDHELAYKFIQTLE